MKLDESVDLKGIARITPGFVGADLANLVNEAALLAARVGKPTVTMLEFNEGVERVVAGLEKRQRVMHPEGKAAHRRTTRAGTPWCLTACRTPIRSTRFRSFRAGQRRWATPCFAPRGIAIRRRKRNWSVGSNRSWPARWPRR